MKKRRDSSPSLDRPSRTPYHPQTMSIINPQTKEINCKIVYYGPALAGKTTSIQALQKKIKSKKSKDASIKTVSPKDRTLFFDFLALSSAKKIKGYSVNFQIYTVPGQVLYEDSRKLLLNGVDGIIFVADSRIEYLEDSIQSLKELDLNLQQLGYSPNEIPKVIQYNKRDSNTAAKVADLNELLNAEGHDEFETIASTGKGVVESFEKVAQDVLEDLREHA